jgi:hypothetical protein
MHRITTFGGTVVHANDGESAGRPMCERPGAAMLTAMDPLVVYLVLVGIAVAVALCAMALTRPLARCCPGCDGDVRFDAHVCGGCGYRFT